jgi:hypothetical protein
VRSLNAYLNAYICSLFPLSNYGMACSLPLSE